MKKNENNDSNGFRSESGAALVTVILISFLLGTACIAMLSAVGASSRNNTDALSEYKAYYAAENGLQASINALRNNGVGYNTAVANPDLNDDFVAGGLNYTGADVIVNADERYRINVVNPDANLPYQFRTTAAMFKIPTTSPFTNKARVCAGILIISANTTNACTAPEAARTEVKILNTSDTTVSFATDASPRVRMNQFFVTKFGGGYQIPGVANLEDPLNNISFRIEYQMTSPQEANRTIRGWLPKTVNPADPVAFKFQTQAYSLAGSEIELCDSDTAIGVGAEGQCPNTPLSPWSFNGSVTRFLWADVSNTEPQRLVITSTGLGPNSSRKQLEAILQKNFFDDLASTSAVSMVGPSEGMVFDAGNGSPTYCGRDGGYEPGEEVPNTPPCTADPNAVSGPSIGVTDPAALAIIIAGSSGATMNPPPDVLTDVPDWQQTPGDLDVFVKRLRSEAQNTGRYVADNGTNKTLNEGNFGSHATGTGLTFCEGNCRVTGSDAGGGILVVTGKFEYNGGMSFNGLVLVTGAAGMERTGGGSGQIIGNVVIAPYNPNNLSVFLPPQYYTSGGGTSDIVFGGINVAFDGTLAVTNLMLGVAEK